ncbi:MAG: tetratricopeptide repeat protein [Nitrospira sp.]|nr:tetratricopeptide repeat protein [Nitrospira sp.]
MRTRRSPQNRAAPAASPNTLSGHELLRIGTIHDQQEHFPESLTYYNLALSKFREKRQPQGIATTLVKIARIDERQGHLQQAHTSLKEAVSLFAKASDRSAHAESLLAIGRVSAQLGLSDESRDALTQAAALFTRVRNARGWNDTMVQLGLLQIAQGENSAGLTTLQQASEEARTRRHVDQQFTATVALGDAHWLLGHTSDAHSAYLDALSLAEAEHHLPFEGMMQLRLARLDGDQASLKDRVAQGKRALQIAQAVHDTAAEAGSLVAPGRSLWATGASHGVSGCGHPCAGNLPQPRVVRAREPIARQTALVARQAIPAPISNSVVDNR